MATANEFSKYYQTISNTALVQIMENPEDHQPLAVEAAKEEPLYVVSDYVFLMFFRDCVPVNAEAHPVVPGSVTPDPRWTQMGDLP